MPTPPSFSPREAFAFALLSLVCLQKRSALHMHMIPSRLMRRECFTRAWLRHCLLRGESPRALRMKWNRCRPTLSCGLRPAVPAALRLACDRPFYSTSGAQCVIRPSASRLSASCAQLRIHTVCLLSLASSVCETGPASLRPLSCPALGPRVIDRPRDSGSGGFAPSSPAQPRLRAAPLRSSPWPSQLAGSIFQRKEKTCS